METTPETVKEAGTGFARTRKRRYRNLILRPFLQFRLGFYFTVLTFGFAVAVTGILYGKLRDLMVILIELTGLEEEVNDLISSYLASTGWWIALAVILFFVANLLVAILFTHKLLGPAIAFRRHVRRLRHEDYSSRIHLRHGDAFQEVATELNALAEELDAKRQRDVNSPVD